jgi:outer membrane protein OmpA-like peptidoglycan-associated protein
MALVLLAGASPATAQEDYSNRLGVNVGGGLGSYTGGKLDHLGEGTMLGGGLRLGWKRKTDILASIRYGSFAAKNVPAKATLDNHTTQLEFGALHSFRPDAGWTPQAFMGGGISIWSVHDLNGQSNGLFSSGELVRGYKDDGSNVLLSETQFHLYGGAAAEFRLIEQASLQLSGRVDWLIDQQIDNSGASAAFDSPDHVDTNELLPSVFVSVHYFFQKRDSDRDGVPDKSDACPYEAEDFDGYQDFDGCPDADNDGDGVPDATDACPDEAEDMDGFEDDDGCPDADNDGDGVLDAQDPCPNEAEDADGFQDDDGCPDPDNDGDGVPDAADQCDGTPAGIAVDESGCPTAAHIDSARTLDVRFTPNEAELDASAYAALDELVESLKAYPEVDVEVQGHTNDQGDAERNRALSQSRAETVVQYLIERGIAPRRLTPVGYGEDDPIVDNDTPENRARNERIMIVPVGAIELDSLELETPEGRGNDGEEQNE